ncbi:carotenoid isomerooxygenase-like [Dermacentor variabilis]|uniref:carotenoid isomerooxygenase-like n=1 Tax=Dermacentor variabilis TaxID=34621 RepID=UPI003F5CA34C
MASGQEASSAPGLDARKFYKRSCAPEVSEPVTGLLRGQLPAWLQGRLLRNGPGLLSFGPDHYNHTFDCPALLREFTIENGQVLYQNRFLRSHAYVRNRRANRIVVSEFGTVAHPDPCATVFERLASYFYPDLSDNAQLNVMPLGDEVYAMTETPDMIRVDPASLETREKKTLSKMVAVHGATSHPLLDADDGAMYNIGTHIGARLSFVLVHFLPGGSESLVDRVRTVGTIPLQSHISVPYVHSFAMTEKWVVVLEQPTSMHLPSMFASRYLGYKALINALQFDANKNVRFHVMNKKTGELHPTVFESAAFFTFHHINAFEQGDELVVDLICYADDSIIRCLDYTVERHMAFKLGRLRRFLLPLNRGPGERVMIKPRELAKDNLRGELPRINNKRNGKPYKYIYSLSNVEGQEHVAFVTKLDVTTGNWLRWERQGWFPSEPVFVARPGAVEEDDGVVLSSLLQEENEKKLALVVLDAKTLKQLALAEFDCPSSIPADFHGCFLEKQT